jgi:MATE family multidrug resistance protein
MYSLLNFLAYVGSRFSIPRLSTTDPGVAALVTSSLPLLGIVTFLDGFGIAANGLLRGIGKQAIGGPTNILSYYAIALPISLGLAFGLQWKVDGLWTGCAVGLTA